MSLPYIKTGLKISLWEQYSSSSHVKWSSFLTTFIAEVPLGVRLHLCSHICTDYWAWVSKLLHLLCLSFFMSDRPYSICLVCSLVHIILIMFLLHFSVTNPLTSRRPTQTRHNFVGETRIFSVKIRINPYPSFMHRCIAKTFTRFTSRCSLQKNTRHCVIKIDSQQQRTKIWPLFYVTWQSDRPTTLTLGQSCFTEAKSPVFFGNLAEKASCVTIKLFGFATHIHKLFFSNMPQIRITAWYGRIISKRPISVLDTDNPYQVACLPTPRLYAYSCGSRNSSYRHFRLANLTLSQT